MHVFRTPFNPRWVPRLSPANGVHCVLFSQRYRLEDRRPDWQDNNGMIRELECVFVHLFTSTSQSLKVFNEATYLVS
jgi:hypothetical protein